jgi:hypothetical protein
VVRTNAVSAISGESNTILGYANIVGPAFCTATFRQNGCPCQFNGQCSSGACIGLFRTFSSSYRHLIASSSFSGFLAFDLVSVTRITGLPTDVAFGQVAQCSARAVSGTVCGLWSAFSPTYNVIYSQWCSSSSCWNRGNGLYTCL